MARRHVCRCRVWLGLGAVVSGQAILGPVDTGTHLGAGVFVATDLHYPASGGAGPREQLLAGPVVWHLNDRDTTQ